MTTKYCPDCGTRASSGICSNCQEELYIVEIQDDGEFEFSDEFLKAAAEQRDYLDRHPIK